METLKHSQSIYAAILGALAASGKLPKTDEEIVWYAECAVRYAGIFERVAGK